MVAPSVRGGSLGAVADNVKRAYEKARAERRAMFAARLPELEWAVRNAFDAAELSALSVQRENAGAKDREVNSRAFWRGITCAEPDHSVPYLCDLSKRYREDEETKREMKIQCALVEQALAALETAAEAPNQSETLQLAFAEAERAIDEASLPVEQRAVFLAKLSEAEILLESDPKAATQALWTLRWDTYSAIDRHVVISDAARESIIETFARLDALATVDLSFSHQQQVDDLHSRLAAIVALGDMSGQASHLVGVAIRAQDAFERAVAEFEA
jgi:uncharacterized protein YoaH (UPF0181 family)